MMNNNVYLLPEDRAYAERRVIQLEKEIQDLGADFNDAFNQSSETWHDNSPFEAVRDKQSMMAAELDKLRTLIRTASLVAPKRKRATAGIGSRVTLNNSKRYLIAGDWTYRAGENHDGIFVVSQHTPIAQALIGKKRGESVILGRIQALIESIDG
ncbi:GreA/GreB family elongation factor [Microbacteriaceae bacterium]|nr:GreA/GreB family elongation factor [Candidatus Saccharibacteria bacterium]